MARSASTSKRVVVVVATLTVSLVACRAFVDLDGLGGGSGVTPAGPDATESDATSTDGANATDGNLHGDSNDVIDATIPDAVYDVSPDVDAALPCPGTGGPAAVRILTSSGSFCIDKTEVSKAQYKAFVAANVSTATQDAFCTWNTSFAPKANWPYPVGEDNLPAGDVNWCDAVAFCKWAGKRLCGKIGGGALSAAEVGNNLINEHAFACSHGGTQLYPYGNVYDGKKCNGGDTADPDVIENVGTRTTCESGWGGVFDLAGNVHEWENSCVVGGGTLQADPCSLQGAAFTHGAGDMTCTSTFGWPRGNHDPEVGFRCCSD